MRLGDLSPGTQLADAKQRERLLRKRIEGEQSGPFKRMLRHELRQTAAEVHRLQRVVALEGES